MMELEHSPPRDGSSILNHMIAGAVAGTTEHCGMFPVDTIKTHIQAYRPAVGGGVVAAAPRSLVATTAQLVQQRGLLGLFRGFNAMVAGAAPAHAVYFAGYELWKKQFVGADPTGHHPFATALAGAMATVMSDAVFTPMDAVKQKLQLGVRSYRGLLDCVMQTYRIDGLRHGFYAGYTTTLVMNVPYSGIYFCSYELMKKFLSPSTDDETPLVHCVAGGFAGIVSAAVTNPLDVARTRLQTQSDLHRQYRGMRDALATLWKDEGMAGFSSGISARMLFHSMAASICWVTYEWMKRFLGDDIGDDMT